MYVYEGKQDYNNSHACTRNKKYILEGKKDTRAYQ